MPPLFPDMISMREFSPPPHTHDSLTVRSSGKDPTTLPTGQEIAPSPALDPEYPIRIPPEKLSKAVELYTTFVLAQTLKKDDNVSHDGYILSPPESSRTSKAPLSPPGSSRHRSVVSFGQSPEEGMPLTSFYGIKVKPRTRKSLPPAARAKAALVRHLGPCQPCRLRRVPCPLDHHDIQTLEPLRTIEKIQSLSLSKSVEPKANLIGLEEHQLALSETEPNHEPTQSSLISRTQYDSRPEASLGLGQNPELLQRINVLSHEDVSLPGLNAHVSPEGSLRHQSPVVWHTHIPRRSSLHSETSVPSARQSPFPETSSDHVEEYLARLSCDASNPSRDQIPPTAESLSIDSEGSIGSNSNDWTAEIAAVVEAAYEAAYGPGPALPSLLFKLQSIFNDVTLEFSEYPFKLEDTKSNDGASQHVGGSEEAGSPGGQNFQNSGSSAAFLGIGSQPRDHPLNGKKKGSSRVKTTKSGANPSVRVFRRLRCHFNARHPHKYCVTRSTGDRYHVCSKSGYLTIAHLKQHNKSTHTVSRCTRCGGLFDTSEERDEHSRADPSEICGAILPAQWPGIDQAENINETIQKRINKNLSARGYQLLLQRTKDALELWVSANITEYVGDSPTSQDLLELRNWYLIWLALFPGVAVPSHPFCDGPSTASAEDGRFIQVFQTIVQEKIAARQMTPIPPNLFNEILERLRETQVIVGTMSQAAQLITLGSAGVEPIPENSSDDTSATPPASAGCPSNQSAQRSAKRPRNDTEVPTGSNRSFQSNQGENESPQIDHVAQQAEVGNMPPRALLQDLDLFNTAQGHAGSFTPGPEVDMGFNGDWLTSEGPWSSTMPRFTDPQQQQPSVSSHQELGLPVTTGYMGTEFQEASGPALGGDLHSFNQEWFDVSEFSNLETRNQHQLSSFDQIFEGR